MFGIHLLCEKALKIHISRLAYFGFALSLNRETHPYQISDLAYIGYEASGLFGEVGVFGRGSHFGVEEDLWKL